MIFCPLNPYYKRSHWKTQVAERFSEALISKLWNKKKHILPKLTEMERNWIIFTPLWFDKKSLTDLSIQGIAMWNSQEKIKSAIPHEQNYAAWLVKNGKTVFSKLTGKISFSVSGKQASRQAGKQASKHSAWSFPFSEL